MPISGNKGEWSEIYAFFKLLGDKSLVAGDKNMAKIERLIYPIIKILREEKDGSIEYIIEGDFILIKHNAGDLKYSIRTFSENAVKLLEKIKAATGSSFEFPETEEFMYAVKCKTLKAKSSDKTDIRMVIHDPITSLNPTLGFSIKSRLGNHSTLLNASKATNFVFKIENVTLDEETIYDINSINTKSKIIDRLKRLKELGANLKFNSIDSEVFSCNLELIDSKLPHIIAEMLKVHFYEQKSGLKEIVCYLQNENPINYNLKHNHLFYEYKVRKFLTDIALGLTPAQPWDGVYEANGGYLIIREDGEIICYHIYNWNEFEEYLLNNTKLDTSSTTRYQYALIEKNGEDTLIKLNLQIRFK